MKKNITIEQLEAIIKYLEKNPEIRFTPYPQYDSQIYKLLDSLGNDHDYLNNYDKIQDKSINKMTLHNLRTKFTFILRGERYNDGHIAAFVKSGELLELAKRELKLLQK